MTDQPLLPPPTEILESLATTSAMVCTWSHPLWPTAWTQEHAARLGPATMPRRIVVTAEQRSDVWNVRIESFTEKQGFAKGWQGSPEDLVQMLWALGFGQLLLQTPARDVQCRRNAKRSTTSIHAPSRTEWTELIADRTKQVPLPTSQFAHLLHVLDLASVDGAIRTLMADKYRQLNHLLTIIEHLPPFREAMPGTTLSIIDAGCGKAYVSFALCAVLVERGVDAHVYGVDTNPHVIEHCNAVAQTLGFGDRCVFEVASISSVKPRPTDLLLALHACDTATDEALALGVRSHARTMIVAPCCHHYVQQQLTRSTVPDFARPLLDDGIVKERLGDMLTDTMRRDIVRAFDYDASLEEFIALEHTAKNVMLKCVARSATPVTEPDLKRLTELRAYSNAWNAMPKLHELISDLIP
ncbi:hypothetical protein BH10BAC6_BH10BAC6_10710 [soil metagenome]